MFERLKLGDDIPLKPFMPLRMGIEDDAAADRLYLRRTAQDETVIGQGDDGMLQSYLGIAVFARF